jgi:hypothetical protein
LLTVEAARISGSAGERSALGRCVRASRRGSLRIGAPGHPRTGNEPAVKQLEKERAPNTSDRTARLAPGSAACRIVALADIRAKR